MPKKTTVFFCKECGFESVKWMGQCPGCREWNTFVEEPVQKSSGGAKSPGGASFSPVKSVHISGVSLEDNKRISSGMTEFDRVLGGGIVPGSLILVGGDPGIGKSTILLQVCKYLSEHNSKVLYISGEESLKQIKMRAVRMGEFSGELLLASETDLEKIEDLIENDAPQIVVIDSIQTMFKSDVSSAPGSVSQVRESTGVLMQIAKRNSVSIFIVGHVTKEGTVAGPRVLEHMVDTVLYFEGDRSACYRILRAVKNRFGATNEVGVFEMTQSGLKEVENPSEFLLNGRPKGASGSEIACIMEGTRPMLLEIQALVAKTSFGIPRRTAVGIDYNRVNLLIAVMERRAGVFLGDCDVYVNITGGMRVSEPSLDLGTAMSIASAYYDKNLPEDEIAFGEIGLAGEIRGVSNVNIRVKEAVKLGYHRILLPQASLKSVDPEYKKYCKGIGYLVEAVRELR